MNKTKQKNSNKALDELSKYAKTDQGKKLLIVGIIGILMGLLWKVVLIAAVIVVVVYLINKRRMGNNKK